MNHQTVRFIQTLDDGVLKRPIQSRHIDLLLIGIIAGPEEVPGHPVYCQAVGIRKVLTISTTKKKKVH